MGAGVVECKHARAASHAAETEPAATTTTTCASAALFLVVIVIVVTVVVVVVVMVVVCVAISVIASVTIALCARDNDYRGDDKHHGARTNPSKHVDGEPKKHAVIITSTTATASGVRGAACAADGDALHLPRSDLDTGAGECNENGGACAGRGGGVDAEGLFPRDGGWRGVRCNLSGDYNGTVAANARAHMHYERGVAQVKG